MRQWTFCDLLGANAITWIEADFMSVGPPNGLYRSGIKPIWNESMVSFRFKTVS